MNTNIQNTFAVAKFRFFPQFYRFTFVLFVHINRTSGKSNFSWHHIKASAVLSAACGFARRRRMDRAGCAFCHSFAARAQVIKLKSDCAVGNKQGS